jgi:hypothetical protein
LGVTKFRMTHDDTKIEHGTEKKIVLEDVSRWCFPIPTPLSRSPSVSFVFLRSKFGLPRTPLSGFGLRTYQPVKKQNSGAWRVTPETLVVSLIVNILSIDEDFAGRIETMWIPETYIHLVIPCPFLGKLSTNLGCSTYCISHHQPDLGPVSRRFAVTMCGGKGVDDCGCIHILYVLEVSWSIDSWW